MRMSELKLPWILLEGGELNEKKNLVMQHYGRIPYFFSLCKKV
jgi:hypothetical protein